MNHQRPVSRSALEPEPATSPGGLSQLLVQIRDILSNVGVRVAGVATVVIMGWFLLGRRVWPATAALLILGIAAGAPAAAAQDPAGQAARRRVRAPAVPSHVLTHSTPVACGMGEAPSLAPRTTVRVATWNIRAARSAPVEAIAAELKAMRVDVVALQEVDLRMRRTGFVDQPRALAAALGFHYVFAASIKSDEGDYGLALLSRWPLADVRRHRLDPSGASEPRIVLEAAVCVHGRPLRVFNHHADVHEASRLAGLAALREIVRGDVGRGVLVLGDFNDLPDAPGVRGLIEAGLVDLAAGHTARTAAGGRIDYLLADFPLARLTSSTKVWATAKSDHHALLADLAW